MILAVSASKDRALVDNDLIERFRAGDSSAFDQIIQRYWDLIYNRVYSLLKNRQDAEEVTQDTFLRAHRGLDKFRGDASFSTWIYQIATNLARNRYWYWFRRKREKSMSLDEPFSEDSSSSLQDIIPFEGIEPAEAAQAQEFIEQVAIGLESLSPDHREVLEMRNRDGLSYDEIASRLGVSIGTVKSRIARARSRLWELMGEEFHEGQ
ncbi:MAG: RNA polymerase sigma factor [Puniceicoccaceae bacterium]